MATILIEPIITNTTGGLAAEIIGISPGNTDQLKGRITTPHGELKVSWDESGFCRNQDPSGNLDIQDDEVAEVIDLARKLSKLGSK